MRAIFINIFMCILFIEKADAQMHRMLIGNMIFELRSSIKISQYSINIII